MKGKLTRQQAISAHCKDCIYDSLAPGNWRQQVSGCSFTECNLYAYRPVSKPVKPICVESSAGVAC